MKYQDGIGINMYKKSQFKEVYETFDFRYQIYIVMV